MIKQGIYYIYMLCCLLMAVFVVGVGQVSFSKGAMAQSVVLSQPVSGSLTSPYGPRRAPKAGASTSHKGQDIASNLADFTSTGTLLSCVPAGGAGNMATVDHGCCVKEVFMHLKTCGLGGGASPTFTTDSTGNITGPHLHWEVHLKGVKVDPAFAIGKNLCDPTTQDQVIQNAYSKLPASAIGGGGGATGDCSAPKPQQEPVDEIDTVLTGEVNPVTGVVNTGPPTIITRTVDGRIIIDVDQDPFDPLPPLPPSVTDGFTQSGPTNNEVTGCATDTWVAMTNQSVLETRREMMMNQRHIAKGDSVLAYSCIGKALESAGEHIGPLFSENMNWANKQISLENGEFSTTSVDLGQGSLDGAIGNAANALAENFISNLFFHNYLGGTQGETPLPEPAAEGEGDDNFGTSQPIDNCATMANVWGMAKCSVITDAKPFPKFSDLIGNDIRQYPQTYRCTDSGITQGMIDIAKGQNVNKSPLKSHLNIMEGMRVTNTPSGPQATFGECGDPIPTGITVKRRKGVAIISLAFDYTDAVCVVPGCSYQNAATWGLGTCER